MGGRNHEGYPDPTASIAMGMVAREEKKKRREESQEEKKKKQKAKKQKSNKFKGGNPK